MEWNRVEGSNSFRDPTSLRLSCSKSALPAPALTPYSPLQTQSSTSQNNLQDVWFRYVNTITHHTSPCLSYPSHTMTLYRHPALTVYTDESRDAYNQNYNDGQPNESSFGHEVVAGAAAFAGMKIFEDHQRKEGKTVNHQFAKELLAGFAGAEADKLAETKGMDLLVLTLP